MTHITEFRITFENGEQAIIGAPNHFAAVAQANKLGKGNIATIEKNEETEETAPVDNPRETDTK